MLSKVLLDLFFERNIMYEYGLDITDMLYTAQKCLIQPGVSLVPYFVISPCFVSSNLLHKTELLEIASSKASKGRGTLFER